MTKRFNIEISTRNILFLLVFINLIIVYLNLTLGIYSDRSNIEVLNDFLIKYINGPLVWIDNILLYIFAILYLVLGIKSKKEVFLKVVFSIFSILTAMISISFILIYIAGLFGMF